MTPPRPRRPTSRSTKPARQARAAGGGRDAARRGPRADRRPKPQGPASTADATPGVRLQKILSQAGVASRRVAEALIEQGRVEVNGRVVNTLGSKADPDADDIRVDGRRLKLGGERKYYLMYKPRGVVSTRSDPQQRETVVDVLAKAGVRGYFYPVGRLDYDSEGLILLTNDGALAEHVLHPKHELERAYEARVLGIPDARDLARLARGIVIDGRRTQPAQVRMIRSYPDKAEPQSLVEIVIREGRNRQVRKMFEGTGHHVMELRRTRIGPITDRRLRPGQVRALTSAEVQALRA